MPSINAFLLRTQKQDVDAIRTTKRILDYSALRDVVAHTAFQLKELGIAPDDKTAVLYNHNADFIIRILALWQIGAVPVPVSTRFTEPEIDELLENTDCNSIIIDEDLSHLKLNSQKLQVSNDAKPKERFLTEEELNPEKTAVIIFTSGSSGKAKGVELSFNSLLQSAKIGNQLLNQTSGDRWLASLPFYHIGGFSIISRALVFSASIDIPDSLNTEGLTASLDEFHPTLISLVPTQLKRLIENSVNPDKELRYTLLGGGHVDNKLFSSAMYDGWNPVKVYGATETSSFVTALTADEWLDKPKSAGKPLKPNLIKIVSESRFPLNAGDVGEIAIYSPALMKGYYNNESETEEKLEDGFYFSGDVGYLDADGYLFIEAKRTDLIISGGENVNPLEVEKAITEHPDIDDAVVFPVKDEEWGELVAAAIVMKENSDKIDLETLENFLKKEIAGYKIPKKIFFENELPKSDLGKVLRAQLVEKYS